MDNEYVELLGFVKEATEYNHSVPIAKKYFLSSSLPTSVKEIIDYNGLVISQIKMENIPKTPIKITLPNFPGISVELSSHYSIGDSIMNDPFELNKNLSDHYEYEDYDILNPKLADQKLYTSYDLDEIKDNFGYNIEKQWKQDHNNNMIIVHKLVAIDIRYYEFKNEIENMIKSIIRDYLIYYHKTALATYKFWYRSTLEQISNDEKELLLYKQDSFRKNPGQSFEPIIETTKDLLGKTKIKSIMEKYNFKNLEFSNSGTSLIQRQRLNELSQSFDPGDSSRNKVLSPKGRLIKKMGNMYKKGDGPIDYGWNLRYFVLDGNTLLYYQNLTEKTPKAVTKLTGASVSVINPCEDRPYAFMLEVPQLERKFILSCDTKEGTEEWRQAILSAVRPELFMTPSNNMISIKSGILTETQGVTDKKDYSLQSNLNGKITENLNQQQSLRILRSAQKDHSINRGSGRHNSSANSPVVNNLKGIDKQFPLSNHQAPSIYLSNQLDLIKETPGRDDNNNNNNNNTFKLKNFNNLTGLNTTNIETHNKAANVSYSKRGSFSIATSNAKAVLDPKLKRMLISKKSKIFPDYAMENIPNDLFPFIRNLEAIANDISQEWKPLKFKDGIKFYAKETKDMIQTFQEVKPLSIQAYAKYGLAFFLLFSYITRNHEALIKLGLLGLGICLFGYYYFSKMNQIEIIDKIGKVLIDEDANNVFEKIKKVKSRKKWDLGVSEIIKTKREANQPKIDSKLQIEYSISDNAILGHNELFKIKCNVQRKCFIMNDEMFYIFENANLEIPPKKSKDKPQYFKLRECYLIQKYAKISGKCMVYLYSKLDTNMLSIFEYEKFREDRFKNLIVIKDFLAEERFKDFVDDLDTSPGPDEIQGFQVPSRNTIYENFPEHSPSKSAQKDNYLSEIKSPREIEILNISRSKSREATNTNYKENGQLMDASKRQNFQTIIDIVNNLIKGIKPSQSKTIEERFPGYKRIKSGGVECQNQEELKCQEGIVMELIRTAGKQILEGKNIVGLSLPVRIFEPRSHLERICDLWSFGPIYLTRAANSDDPLERMKNVMAFALAGMYLACKQLKPFNPILGETYQAFWPDGSEVYCEHISHHPPISAFMYRDSKDRYKYTGYYEYKGGLKGNSVNYIQEGPNKIQFSDGQTIVYNLPAVRLSGLLYGSRIIELNGQVIFKDETRDLIAKLAFYENNSIFSKSQHPSDYIEGTITRISNPNMVLSTVKGLWTGYLEFDGKRYWDLEYVDYPQIIKISHPLPSDCRFREDMLYLARKDLVKAQEKKVALEVIQRADRKLRNEYKEKVLKINSGH